MISARHKKKPPFWGLGLLPLGRASRSFPLIFVKVGKNKRPISNEIQTGRWIYDRFIESSDRGSSQNALLFAYIH